VRINKPCVLKNFAADWKLTEKWNTEVEEEVESSHASMLETIGADTSVRVY